MKYRKFPRGGYDISEIGIGLGKIYQSTDKDLQEVLEYSTANGINCFDLYMDNIKMFDVFKAADMGDRKKFYTQMQLGIVYNEAGEYGRVRDFEKVKRSFETSMEKAGLDYTDFGLVHCVDEEAEVKEILENGTWDYMKELKKQGVIRHMGFSSHTPKIAKMLIDTGDVDMFMFSINPAYDYTQGKYGYGDVEERMNLYKYAEKLGIGISIMKPFCAGQLLDERTSPIGIALTLNQCLKYGLDRPAVFTTLPGPLSVEHVKQFLSYYDASDEDKDYSILGKATPSEAIGRCVYCGHCAPCPAGLDIGLINKFYDLAKIGDDFAIDHYKKLSLHASDCIQCGNCNDRCPFSVKQAERMLEIKDYFGI